MPTTPNSAEVWQAASPVILRDFDDLSDARTIRFSYSREASESQPANSLLLILESTTSGKRCGLLFKGVEMEYFPLLTPWGDAQVLVQNRHLAQHESKKPLAVFMRFCDGMEEPLFLADSVEDVQSATNRL